MIRRDYILNQVERFAAVLANILGLTKKGEWQNASAAASRSFSN